MAARLSDWYFTNGNTPEGRSRSSSTTSAPRRRPTATRSRWESTPSPSLHRPRNRAGSARRARRDRRQGQFGGGAGGLKKDERKAIRLLSFFGCEEAVSPPPRLSQLPHYGSLCHVAACPSRLAPKKEVDWTIGQRPEVARYLAMPHFSAFVVVRGLTMPSAAARPSIRLSVEHDRMRRMGSEIRRIGQQIVDQNSTPVRPSLQPLPRSSGRAWHADDPDADCSLSQRRAAALRCYIS